MTTAEAQKYEKWLRLVIIYRLILLQVQEYKDSLKTKAEQLLLKGFPEKIVKLNELLETQNFSNRNFSEVHQQINIPIPDPIVINHSEGEHKHKRIKLENSADDASGTKVMVLPTGPIPCNKPLCDMIHIVKPYIIQLLEDSNLVNIYYISNEFRDLDHLDNFVFLMGHIFKKNKFK